MFTFVDQLIDLMRNGVVHYFLIFFVFVWFKWFVVKYFASRYKPYITRFSAKTSVLIPVVDEPIELFTQVIRNINKQNPTEVIVIINGPRNKSIEEVCSRYKKVRYVWTRQPGKRNAIRVGMKYVKGDIVLLVDSDTLWEKSLLSEIKKPFREPSVGGVTSYQRIYNPGRTWVTRFADWLEEIRGDNSMPAMSAVGKVGCLPGRTIAFRRSILEQVLDEFMNERFMGLHKEVSDDRSLTNLALKAGYKTVMQKTARVTTDAPLQFKKFFRQQLRWSEGSQYNNLRMTPWMLRNAKLTLFIFWSDTLIPFVLFGIAVSSVATSIHGAASIDYEAIFNTLVVGLAGAAISIGVRNIVTFFRNPSVLLMLPFFIIIMTFVMTTIRIVGFLRCADDLGWGTRNNAYKTKSDPLPTFSNLRFVNALRTML